VVSLGTVEAPPIRFKLRARLPRPALRVAIFVRQWFGMRSVAPLQRWFCAGVRGNNDECEIAKDGIGAGS